MSLIPCPIPLLARYSDLRRLHPSLDKGDALIAATALVKRLPLMTRIKCAFSDGSQPDFIRGVSVFPNSSSQ